MRGLTTVVLALAGLAAHALAHSTPPPVSPIRRKTLGFGPDLPHARFGSADVHVASAFDVATNPYTVARDWLSQHDDPHAGRTYVIRPDSYTDHATGVTHVYARQVIGGIEVANAHVNLNIKDGRVLSVGDSFFTGQVQQNSHVPVHPHAYHCAQLSSALDLHRSLLQSSLPSHERARVSYGLVNLEHLHVSNCANVPSLSSLASVGEVDMDPRRPLLAFLASALPENHPEYASLEDKLEEHVVNMIMTPETHLLGNHAYPAITLSNVPGAVSEVKTRVVWIQVPTEHGIKLELVHRFEVEMEHNWYETTVTTSIPHRIVSVIDWASDSPMPMSVVMEGSHLPNLGAFVPPGTTFDSVASAQARGRRLGKAVAGKKGSNSYAPVPKNPQVPQLTKASYLVFPWGTNDPVEAAQRKALTHGEPTGVEYPLSYGREIVKELGDTLASPAGWHTLPCSSDPNTGKECAGSYWHTTKTTWGNNVFAHENWEGKNNWIYNERPTADVDSFTYPYSPQAADTEYGSMEQAKEHINATVTQLFYTSNMVHDLFYRYGFTEASGNFQQFNFERGGAEGDAVIANAQDGSGFNNANFMTPPDGQNGRCRMYLWTTDSPYPDGDMEAGIVIHELSHGLSTRLTGGPKNSGCLGWGEAGGMGEGWGDFIATSVRSTSSYSDYTMGAWASNSADGIRNYPYSTSTSTNPSTYETLDDPGYWGVHAVGEVWAEMLWVLQQRFIAKHGFSQTLLPPVPDADGTLPPNDFYRPQTFNSLTGSPNPLVPKHGNTLLLQLVINGMKLQPCSPSFFDARAAIIDADKVLTGGENFCDIWEGFAERGLGRDAAIIGSTPWGGGARTNGFRVPSQCRPGEPEPEPEPEPLPTPGNPDDCDPVLPWCWLKNRMGKWVPKLPWGYNYYY